MSKKHTKLRRTADFEARIAWIDRVIRAIDMAPGPPPFNVGRQSRDLREALGTYRDGLVTGSNLSQERHK